MPQTLLAFAGILLITTHAFTVQQWSIFSQRKNITRELEEMAGAVALEAMETIRTRAFDQAEADGLVGQTLGDLKLMSFVDATNHFVTGRACSVFEVGTDICDDIDDFHKMKTATVPFVMAQDTINFKVDVEVSYVTDGLLKALVPTFNKKVVVSVQDTWDGSNSQPFLAQPVRLERVFSYGF